jgi:hypothetical protein
MSEKKLRNQLVRLAHGRPELRKELLPILARKDKPLVEGIRSPYYEAADKVVGLKDIAEDTLPKDVTLKHLVRKLDRNIDDIYRHLSAHYTWD